MNWWECTRYHNPTDLITFVCITNLYRFLSVFNNPAWFCLIKFMIIYMNKLERSSKSSTSAYAKWDTLEKISHACCLHNQKELLYWLWNNHHGTWDRSTWKTLLHNLTILNKHFAHLLWCTSPILKSFTCMSFQHSFSLKVWLSMFNYLELKSETGQHGNMHSPCRCIRPTIEDVWCTTW